MKVIVESKKCEEFYFELMMKVSNGKKLSQYERVFVELYDNKSVPCYHFVNQIKPAIMRYGARISELRADGFIIPAPTLTYKDGQKHSTYTLDKTHFEVEEKRSWWSNLWKA